MSSTGDGAAEVARAACRGLSLTETVAFAVALADDGVVRGLAPAATEAVTAALSQLPEAVAPDVLGRLILGRLDGAHHPNVHPEWAEHHRARERRHLFDEVASDTADPFVRQWLEPMLRRTTGHIDPRHTAEAARAEVLEFDQLALLPHADLAALATRLGVDVGAAALAALGRRQLAALLRRLDGPIAGWFAAAVRRGEGYGRETLRVARARLVSLEQGRLAFDGQLRDLGVALLATACMGRFQLAHAPIAHALPVAQGQWMLDAGAQERGRTSALAASPDLVRVALETLQALARAGETALPYHQRRLVLAPPASLR